MAAELSLYISAAQEMDAECELIGRRLAEGVKSIRWRIWRTPWHQEVNPDESVLAASQFYGLLLGTDLVAPMGVEWQMAARGGAFIMAFRDATRSHSPAAQYFARNSEIAWQDYKTPEAFIQLFERTLLTQLIDGTPGYGLNLADIESIAARLKAIAGEQPEADQQRRGAGQGGIILPAR